jgi:hypothetical protein
MASMASIAIRIRMIVLLYRLDTVRLTPSERSQKRPSQIEVRGMIRVIGSDAMRHGLPASRIRKFCTVN